VKDYVRLKKLRGKEMFVPLVHPPGQAQADFGEAKVVHAIVELPASYALPGNHRRVGNHKGHLVLSSYDIPLASKEHLIDVVADGSGYTPCERVLRLN
nr:hypothetical protein [Terriglobales bacterium]